MASEWCGRFTQSGDNNAASAFPRSDRRLRSYGGVRQHQVLRRGLFRSIAEAIRSYIQFQLWLLVVRRLRETTHLSPRVGCKGTAH